MLGKTTRRRPWQRSLLNIWRDVSLARSLKSLREGHDWFLNQFVDIPKRFIIVCFFRTIWDQLFMTIASAGGRPWDRRSGLVPHSAIGRLAPPAEIVIWFGYSAYILAYIFLARGVTTCRAAYREGGGGKTESIATLPPFGPIEVQKWFDQISSQWESQKNQFAFIFSGKIQFLPPCTWNLPFMSYRHSSFSLAWISWWHLW